MIKKIYQKILSPKIRNKIRRLLGHITYNPIKKGFHCDYIYIHIPKTGGTSISNIIGDVEHRTAKEVIEIVGRKKWDRSFKFAFIRNPWELVFSHYNFKVKENHQNLRINNIEFVEWVNKVYGPNPDSFYRHSPKMYQSQFQWLIDDKKNVSIDFIGVLII